MTVRLVPSGPQGVIDVAEPQQAELKVRDYEIVVNGTMAVVHDAPVSYEEVVLIAFPGTAGSDVIYSVTYRRADGPHGGEGILVAGESVRVRKDGTIFDVYPTTRS